MGIGKYITVLILTQLISHGFWITFTASTINAIILIPIASTCALVWLIGIWVCDNWDV